MEFEVKIKVAQMAKGGGLVPGHLVPEVTVDVEAKGDCEDIQRLTAAAQLAAKDLADGLGLRAKPNLSEVPK